MTDRNTSGDPQHGFNPEQAFDRAVTLHRAGRLAEAEQFYRAILDLNAKHFGALLYLAVIAGQHRQFQDAEQLIRRALVVKPNSAEAHSNLGLTLTELGRFDEALAEHENAVVLEPHNLEARNSLGNALHAIGRSGDAISHFEQALALAPDMPELHNNLGNALRAAGREQDAITSFRKALASRPGYAEAHNNIGVALAAIGKYEDAVAAHEHAVALRPQYFEAHNNLANALAALGRQIEAIDHFERALMLNPDAAGTHNSYGNLLAASKRLDDAVSHYNLAVDLKPNFFEAYNNLGNALAASDHPSEGIRHYRKAIEINPGYAEAHSNLGNLYSGLERYEEAISCFRDALAIAPRAEIYGSLGSALITVGRIDEALEVFDKAIALNPRHPEYYRGIGECRRFTADDPYLAAMEGLSEELSSLTAEQQTVLRFVLAKAYDDVGRHDAAFRHLSEGNRLRRAQVAYDETATLGLHERVAKIFTPDLIRAKAGGGDPSPVPIFIIGMPRSGTTLIEQILASHPGVFGAGEILTFQDAMNTAVGPSGLLREPYPEAVLSMTAEHFHHVGAHYVRHVKKSAPAAHRIVDKALGNFLNVGLIHLALPRATIIHAARDPADIGFSCFSKMFGTELLYTYDLSELGRYCRSYENLMAHWQYVLPKGDMLRVQYEDLVSDLETHARRIIAHCGLDWDDRCLTFHETRRPIRTASATQVRRPIYRSSVARWRPYATMMEPFLSALGRESD
ncbi:MAG TPA: tetratricopeptide repeat protein [Xanthobacteraceae bacterium]|nr:tetratricopeptide repeat protein [Xanthobacteraceae bacterium]